VKKSIARASFKRVQRGRSHFKPIFSPVCVVFLSRSSSMYFQTESSRDTSNAPFIGCAGRNELVFLGPIARLPNPGTVPLTKAVVSIRARQLSLRSSALLTHEVRLFLIAALDAFFSHQKHLSFFLFRVGGYLLQPAQAGLMSRFSAPGAGRHFLF